MSLPLVSTQVELPQGFHRGATIGSIGGVVAAAGQHIKRKYDTKTKRVIRMRMASLMIKPVTSFTELSDHELQGMYVACKAGVTSIAQWLAGQDFPYTEISGLYDNLREERSMDGDHWGDNAW